MNPLKRIFVLALLWLPITASAQTAGQLKDFEIFEKGLRTIEAKLDRQVSMDSINQMLTYIKGKVGSGKLDAVEEYKLYASCINLIQSGHTQLIPTKSVLKQWAFSRKSLPFDMVIVNKKLYLDGYSKKYDPDKLSQTQTAKGSSAANNAPKKKSKKTDRIPVGAEIVAIDNISFHDWIKLSGKYIGSDEDDPVFKYTIASQAFDFFRFIATEKHKDSVQVHYIEKRDTLSRYIKLGYPPLDILMDRLDEMQKQQEKDLRSIGKFKVMGNVGYFRFPSFFSCYGRKYSDFLKTSFEKVKSKKLQMVVLDLRGNGGGIMQVELLSYFLNSRREIGNYQIVKRPVRKDRKHIQKSNLEYRRHKKNVRKMRRLERKYPEFHGQMFSMDIDTSLVFRGTVVVLTDEGTFSAASVIASQLKAMRGAKIMGSRAGGTFYGCNAGTLKLKLPHSKIVCILNPNSFNSTLNAKSYDASIKDVDFEIIPEYSPKDATYKKNWEGVIKTAIRKAD